MHLAALEKEKELEIAARNVSEANERIIRLDRDFSVAVERAKSLRETMTGLEQDVQILKEKLEAASKKPAAAAACTKDSKPAPKKSTKPAAK